MTLETRWVPEAIEDLRAGYDWYDERQAGLGSQLAAETFEAVAEGARFPLAHKRYEHAQLPELPEVRKVQLGRFSEYGVIYTVVDDTFWVIAVAHAKRRPGYWADRLDTLR